MIPEERQLLAGLFERTRAAATAPRDHEAEAFIADAVRAQPYVPYVLSQTVIVMEQTLTGASQRIEQLEAQVRELEARAAAPAAGSGSFLGGLFGGKPAVQPAPPASAPSPWGRAAVPQVPVQGGGYAPAPQQAAAPWQQAQAAPAAGGSFLKSALGTAAGVAGGVMLAHSLQGMFSGHGNQGGFGGGMGGNNASLSNGSGGDSLLDGPPSQGVAQANYGSGGQDHSTGDSGGSDAQYASYDDSSSGGGGDSTDV